MPASNRALHQPQLPAFIRQQPGHSLKKREGGGLTKKVKLVCDLLVHEGYERAEACKEAGLSEKTILAALRKPLVLRYLREQTEVLRDGERFRNIRTGIKLRDKAESEHVQLKAAQWLHGESVGSNAVQVNVGVQVTPGYVIDLREDGDSVKHDAAKRHQMLELAASEAKLLIDKDDVPQT